MELWTPGNLFSEWQLMESQDNGPDRKEN